MFNYYKRGNRLSAQGSANQQANTYGLTVKLPVIESSEHTGASAVNIGITVGSGNSSLTVIPVSLISGQTVYPGQLLRLGSEQLYVRFTFK